MKQTQKAFTIVELLIVIVVIAILAAISIIAYNGIQDRARLSSLSSDMNQSTKNAKLSAADSGSADLSLLITGDFKIKTASGIYKIFSVCASDQGKVVAGAQLNGGDKYYSIDGAAAVKDNTIDVTRPCNSLSITNTNGSTAPTIYGGMPSLSANCSIENGTCSFTGVKTVAYGSTSLGKFYAKTDQVSPVACNNTNFGDPAIGAGKRCYVLEY